jgi:hypothetical protein
MWAAMNGTSQTIAFTWGGGEGLFAFIGVIFVLLVIIGFLPDRATSVGKRAADALKSASTSPSPQT